MDEEGVGKSEKAGTSRKLVAGIIVAAVVIASIGIVIWKSQSNNNMGITHPSPNLRLAIINDEYIWNVTTFLPANTYPDIDWYNLNNYAILVINAQYGYYYYTHPNVYNTNYSHVALGPISDYLNSSGDIVYFDNDFDHNISVGDSLIFRGDLAKNISSINENLSFSSDVLWLNLFFINGIKNDLGKETLHLMSRPFVELEYNGDDMNE